MAKDSQAAASLRALTYRITSSTPQHLPFIAPQIAASLWNCRPILSTIADAGKPTETSQTITKFRSSISHLLQGRSIEERWAAVVLAKASIEAGGVATISKATGWTKNLIAILKKNDPPTTKVLAIITLTRIFMLTWSDANLVREITTPALPGVVQGCLAAAGKARAENDILQTVLEAFATLVPKHPTIFRTYEGQIRELLVKILSSTPSNHRAESHHGKTCREAASRLYTLLHYCAPKQGAPEKWDETLKATIAAAHSTCDRIFRAINESWKPNDRTTKVSTGELELPSTDAAGLGAWQGMHAGAERLVTLLGLLQAHIQCPTSGTTTVRLGMIFDFLQRLLELDTSVRDQHANFNPQIEKDEREQLIEVLPGLHVAAIDLLDNLLQRFDWTLTSAASTVMEPLCTVFSAERADATLRATVYRTMQDMLRLIGPSLPRDSVADLAPVITSCCEDLVPRSQISDRSSSKQPASGQLKGGASPISVSAAASDLLRLFFTKLNQAYLPAKLRNRMEQTAVLTKHKDALVAAVLNPHRKAAGTAVRPSLLPILAREFPGCPEVEAILRPRMPLVVGGMEKAEAEAEGLTKWDGESEAESSSGEEHDERSAVDGVMENGALEDDATSHDQPLMASADGGEEIFSTAPELALPHTSFDPWQQQSQKRPASPMEQQREEGISKRIGISKRMRTSPVAAAVASEPVAGVVQVSAGPTGSQTTVVPAQEPVAGGQGGDDGSDDNDFEIPPLTMESDSEVEEAEE